jgi:predicted RNA-binding protein (virulence factor B family)
MVDIGNLNTLKVVKEVDFGVYLDGEEFGKILLPKNDVPANCKIDDELNVFIYTDSEDRIIATTRTPKAMVGDFAYLKVIAVNDFGAFLDWGLNKDLLVPFHEQQFRMKEGESYIVKVYLDEKTERIAATSYLDSFLDLFTAEYYEGQEVELMICKKTDLGYNAIINNSHWGLLYDKEIFRTINIGQKVQGYIKKVREDGKIDLTLNKSGYEKIDDISQKILDILKEQGGFILISDKSSPEIIYDMFGESKKTYKKAIGSLYKKHLILIGDEGIRIV